MLFMQIYANIFKKLEAKNCTIRIIRLGGIFIFSVCNCAKKGDKKAKKLFKKYLKIMRKLRKVFP